VNNEAAQWYARSGGDGALSIHQPDPYEPEFEPSSNYGYAKSAGGYAVQCVQDPADGDGMMNMSGISIKNTFLTINTEQPIKPLQKVSTAGGRLELLAQCQESSTSTPRDWSITCY
jgi:hypothetical protein